MHGQPPVYIQSIEFIGTTAIKRTQLLIPTN